MFRILSYDLLQFVLLGGVGSLFQRLCWGKTRLGPFAGFWLGLIVVITVAQLAHLIVPLNAQARSEVGNGMPVADYQRLVHARYADKLPGSAYDRSGKAGGYGGDESVQWPWIAGAAAIILGLIVPRRRSPES